MEIQWVGGSRSHLEFCFFENRPKIALNQYWYFAVHHVYYVCIRRGGRLEEEDKRQRRVEKTIR